MRRRVRASACRWRAALCRLMGGELRVERTGAQGTQMRIELPRFHEDHRVRGLRPRSR